MADTPWQQQFKQLVARASEEFKRTSEELKKEGQRLLEEVRDPVKQQKMKEGLREIGTWAKKTADQAAVVIDAAVKKAEATWNKSADEGQGATEARASSRTDETEAEIPHAPPPPKKTATKTVGKKKAAGSGAAPARKPAGKAAPKTAKKSIGGKKPKSS